MGVAYLSEADVDDWLGDEGGLVVVLAPAHHPPCRPVFAMYLKMTKHKKLTPPRCAKSDISKKRALTEK